MSRFDKGHIVWKTAAAVLISLGAIGFTACGSESAATQADEKYSVNTSRAVVNSTLLHNCAEENEMYIGECGDEVRNAVFSWFEVGDEDNRLRDEAAFEMLAESLNTWDTSAACWAQKRDFRRRSSSECVTLVGRMIAATQSLDETTSS